MRYKRNSKWHLVVIAGVMIIMGARVMAELGHISWRLAGWIMWLVVGLLSIPSALVICILATFAIKYGVRRVVQYA